MCHSLALKPCPRAVLSPRSLYRALQRPELREADLPRYGAVANLKRYLPFAEEAKLLVFVVVRCCMKYLGVLLVTAGRFGVESVGYKLVGASGRCSEYVNV